MTLKYTRRRIAVQKYEVLDAVEMERDGKREYYSYTYKVHLSGVWLPQVRWDNLDSQPHVDVYDESGRLKESGPTVEKRLDEVIRMVNAFRRGLLNVPVTEL